jgi:hypothetical protein
MRGDAALSARLALFEQYGGRMTARRSRNRNPVADP